MLTMNEQPRFTISHAYWINACLLSNFPHGTQLRSLLLHQSVKFVFAKLALDTLCRSFVAMHQLCTAILAAFPPSTRKIQNLCRIQYCCHHNAASPRTSQSESPTDDTPHNRAFPVRPGSLHCCFYEFNVSCGAIMPPQYDCSTECVCWKKMRGCLLLLSLFRYI